MSRLLLIGFVIASVTTSATAPLAFGACEILLDVPQRFAVDPRAGSMTTADFNEDGILDLAIANTNEATGGHGKVTVLLGLGGRRFSATAYATHDVPAYHIAPTVSHGVVTADFNHDGILDLAVGYLSYEFSVLLGRGSGSVGDGTFGPAVRYGLPELGSDLAAGDFDQDGHVDLAVCVGMTVAYFRGSGDGTFSSAGRTGFQSSCTAIVAADLDGDGTPDLAVTFKDRVAVLRGPASWTGSDLRFPALDFYAAGGSGSGIDVADVDADGRPDLIVSLHERRGIRVLEGTATGAFAAGASIAVDNSKAVEAVDLDGDGNLDLVTGLYDGNGTGRVTIIRGNGDGAFAEGESTSIGMGVYEVAAGDFDGDGRADLFVSNFGHELAFLPGLCTGNPLPSIASFEPSQAPPGHVITIQGRHLSTVTDVRFDETPASFTIQSFSRILATVPDAATTGPLRIVNPAGTATSTTNFVVGPLASFDTMAPLSGTPGTVVTLQGNAFDQAVSVRFEATAASFEATSSTQIRAVVPSAAHTGRVSVDFPSQTFVRLDTFFVSASIASVEPLQAPAGDVITIHGYNFTRATDVSFNGASASFTLVSDDWITATVPAAATSGPIQVANPAGVGTFYGFTVGPLIPIASFSPAVGMPGTLVTIRGSGFAGATAVRFGGTLATFVFESDSEVRATVPHGARTGPITMTVRGGTISSADTFVVAPVVLGFHPLQAPAGHVITITGHNFTGASSARFSSGAEASFTVVDDDQIVATVPASASNGPIRVTNPAGFAESEQPFSVGPIVGDGGGINLSWEDCGAAGVGNQVWACDADLGPAFGLVASFDPPTGMTEYLGLNARLDVRFESGALPNWWQHGQSLCRGNQGIAVSFDFTSGPFTCTDFFSGQAAGGFVYEPGFASADHARLRVTAAIPFDHRGPITPGTEYYAFKALIRRANTTTCVGCAEPACITLNEIQLFQPPERRFDPILNAPLERLHVTWQIPPANCPMATPVLVSLVSAEARPEGVALVWQTGAVDRATAYRRENGATWRDVAVLVPDGGRRVRYEDTGVTPGTVYEYRLGVVVGGTEIFLGETRVEVPAAAALGLTRAAWDPSRHTVVVALTLATREPAQVEIFDLAGRRWSGERIEDLGPGVHEIALGTARGLQAGVYFARLTQGASLASRRFVVVL